jgi:hypothetical protein
MAKQDKGKVSISGRFSPGTTVELHERGSADVYQGAGTGKVTQAKTDKNGVTTFSAPPGNYFAIATEKEWNVVTEQHEDRVRSVDVTVPNPQQGFPADANAPAPVGPEPPAPSFLDNAQIVVGARSSADGNATVDRTMLVDERTGMVSEFATPVGRALPAKEIPNEGVAPGPRIEDNRDEPLASSTLTGEAIPPQEQPPAQSEAKKTQKQASSTEEGVIVPAREQTRQEDFKGKQASDTQTGRAFPVDPNAPQRSGSGTGRSVHTGSSSPIAASHPVEAAKTPTPEQAAKKARKANKSRQARAARKASGTSAPETKRSRADTTAQDQPTEDARGVQHVEVPEDVGTPKK